MALTIVTSEIESFLPGDRPGPMTAEATGETVYAGEIVEVLGSGRYRVETDPDPGSGTPPIAPLPLAPDEVDDDGVEHWNVAAVQGAELALEHRPDAEEPAVRIAGHDVTRETANELFRALAHLLAR